MLNDLRLDAGLKLEEAEAMCRRFPRHRGSRLVLAQITAAPDRPHRSPWEVEWPPFAAKYALPPHRTNTMLVGHEVDVYFAAHGVIVELDGWGTHGTRFAFKRDRNRDAEILAKTGIVTVRIVHDDFHQEPDRKAAELLQILSARERRTG